MDHSKLANRKETNFKVIRRTVSPPERKNRVKYEMVLDGWPEKGCVEVTPWSALAAFPGLPDEVHSEIDRSLGWAHKSLGAIIVNEFYPYGKSTSQHEIDASDFARKGNAGRLLSDILLEFPPESHQVALVDSPVVDAHGFFEKLGFQLIKAGTWWGYQIR